MTTLSVPEMNCGHCKASVEAALTRLDPAAEVAVDLPTRRVEVRSTAPPAAMIAALSAVGFDATAA